MVLFNEEERGMGEGRMGQGSGEGRGGYGKYECI